MTIVKFTNVHGFPYAEFHCDENINRYASRRSWQRKISHPAPNVIRMPINICRDFASANKDLFGCSNLDCIEVDKDSIKKFYGFYNNDDIIAKCVLSKNLVCDSINRAYRLTRFEINVDRNKNLLGITPVSFEVTLYDYSTENGQIEEMTQEEADIILSCIDDDSIMATSIKRFLENTALPKDEQEAKAYEANKIISDYQNNLNNIFEKYKNEVQTFEKTLPEHAFDCGFTEIKTNNDKVNEAFQLLLNIGKIDYAMLRTKFYDNYFNSSHSHDILYKYRDLANENEKELLNEIYVVTHLD